MERPSLLRAAVASRRMIDRAASDTVLFQNCQYDIHHPITDTAASQSLIEQHPIEMT
ncbi:hypothetical protein ACO2JO_17870 [Leptospira interrogans]